MKTHLQKWGNSLAIRIPREAVNRGGFRLGDELEVTVLQQGTLRVRRGRQKAKLSDLVRKIKGRNQHAETDWGSRRGREAW